ncbi:phytoene/squalene synthase family protein [bacterium]|nr:phytoene/squalene synthase family protein [Chloroflexi bacterium CFX6]RIL09001.1 MAG: phytoene/squalene synthase family protein [bacterium]
MIASRLVRIFHKGSRTYFYSSLFFSGAVKRDVFALYAFVRTADDFVDEVPQDAAGFEDFVARYRAALAGRLSGDAVIDGFVELAARKRFDPAWTESFLDAMRQDLTQQTYDTLDDVERYMYGSAEVIGLFMARVLDLPDAALPAARRLGKAMQYANFLRDVAHDRTLGRTYLPRTVLDRHGLPSLAPEAIAAHPERFEALMRDEIARYRRWQAQAELGYAHLPPRARIPIRTAADMYVWATGEIARRPAVVFERQVKPSVGRILARIVRNAAASMGPSSGALTASLARLVSWR